MSGLCGISVPPSVLICLGEASDYSNVSRETAGHGEYGPNFLKFIISNQEVLHLSVEVVW